MVQVQEGEQKPHIAAFGVKISGMYYVYILQSLNEKRRYIGQTNDLERRLGEHNTGRSPFTKGRGPWELIYWEEFKTRTEAIKREHFMKSGKGREFLQMKLGQSI